MALWLTVVIALTCLGGLASPGPLPPSTALKEVIEELINITQNQKAPLCNGSMVWSVNWTAGMQYCAALESLLNISSCGAIQKTQRMLKGLCTHEGSARVSSLHTRDTKIEVDKFVKDLLRHLRKIYHHN